MAFHKSQLLSMESFVSFKRLFAESRIFGADPGRYPRSLRKKADQVSCKQLTKERVTRINP